MADGVDVASPDGDRGTWDTVLAMLTAAADAAGLIDWSLPEAAVSCRWSTFVPAERAAPQPGLTSDAGGLRRPDVRPVGRLYQVVQRVSPWTHAAWAKRVAQSIGREPSVADRGHDRPAS